MVFEYYTNGRVFRHYQTPSGCDTASPLKDSTVNTFSFNDFRRESVQTNERGMTRRFLFDRFRVVDVARTHKEAVAAFKTFMSRKKG